MPGRWLTRRIFAPLIASFTCSVPCDASGAGVFLSAGGGWFEYLSPGISEMNRRLGNSPLLSVKSEHTGAVGYDASVFLFDKFMNTFYSLSILSISEDISARNARASMTSSLALQGLGLGIGTRLFPFARNGFVSPRGKARRNPQRLYVLGLFEAWPLALTHRYALKVNEAGTDISYSFTGLHLAGALRLQGGFALAPGLHLFARVSYLGSVGLVSQTDVKRLRIDGLDYRYRANRLDLSWLSKSGVECIQGSVGVSFAL